MRENEPTDTDPSPEVLLLLVEERVDEYLGVEYLAASLRSAAVKVKVAQWERPADRNNLERWLGDNPSLKLVGIPWLYIFSEPRVARAAALVKLIRPDVKVVVGGHPVSFEYRRALKTHPTIDCVVCGEGDHTIVELFAAIRSGADLKEVRGLAYREASGEIIATEPRGQIRDLDSLPLAARDTLFQVLDTYENPSTVVVRMIGSRGCYARCEFCSMVAFYDLDGAGMKWRPRGAAAVAEEVAHIVNTTGLRRFWFADDEFIGPPRVGVVRLMELAERFRRESPDIEWGFDTRANGIEALSPNQLEALHESGLRVVAMGLESGSQSALRRLNKGMNVRSNWRAIEALRAAGIDYRYGFIMYDPGTTLVDLQLNLDFLRFAEPHRICNTGPFRFLNAEFPEVGTPMSKRLNLDTHHVDTTRVNSFPKLEEGSLGYSFSDQRVSRYRRLCHRVAAEIVEPAMLPRPINEPPFRADTWWTGINYHPRNVSAMNAFLDTMAWLLDQVADDTNADEVLIFEMGQRFQEALCGCEQRLKTVEEPC